MNVLSSTWKKSGMRCVFVSEETGGRLEERKKESRITQLAVVRRLKSKFSLAASSPDAATAVVILLDTGGLAFGKFCTRSFF